MIQRNHALGLAAFALLTVFASAAAYAQTTFLPYASEQYEHNNNIFYLPNSAAAIANNGDPTLGDSSLRTVAGADVNFLWDRQRFYSTLEARYIDYSHFGYLSHTEYLAKAGLDWKLLSAFDGTFLGSIEQSKDPFPQRYTQPALGVDLDRHSIGRFNFRITPDWRLETSVDYHDLDSPIQDFPAYGLTETTGHAALKYLGFSDLTYGFTAEYIDGKYRNAPVPGSYEQTNLDLTMTYTASGLSSFNGAIGYTKRDQGQNQGNFSALTGELGYLRRLSGKTSLHLDLARAVNSYIGAGGSELDTTALAQLTFQPTYKTGMSLSYQYIWSKFEAQTIPGSDVLGRRDRTPGTTFKVNYQALRWLLIQPYLTYQRRDSNEQGFNFSSTIIGIQILAKKPAPPQAKAR
jgi:hypothetical protein